MAAEAAISSAVQLLGSLLIEKVKFLGGVESEVQLLKEELSRMHSFLGVANRKVIEDPVVRQWVSDLREVSQDTEDMVEMFLINVQNQRFNTGAFKTCTGFANCVGHLHRIGDEIESIRARLDAIDKSRDRYGIKDLGETAAVRSSQVELRRRLAPWEKDEDLVGVENDVKKLLRESILNKENKGLSIAVVEGMGGIGKSTLARAVYNHPDVAAHGGFEWRAWVVVSAEFNPHETIKQLIMELPGSVESKDKVREEIKKLEEVTEDELYLLQKLQQMLHKLLEGKTYFIVVDDVWEKEHWKSLRPVFPDQQDKTCRLLVTTRNRVIAKYGDYAHEVKALDTKKSWELFLRKALIHKSDGECPQELEPIGRKIVEKCNGLPLAISIVGGLLGETQTKSGWEDVLNQINSHLGSAESSTILAILELSYQYLSPHLKSCFLCLALFKEDAIISVKRLVHIWNGQGLIQQEVGISVGEIARGYLDELINRNMVQINDWSIDGRVKNCRLHDLVREVCLRKAKEEIGLEIVKAEGENSCESRFRARHRVVHGTFPLSQNEHIRSLFLVNVNPGFARVYASSRSSYWNKFHLIKTVDLDGFGFRRIPQCFRALLGLKYLRIRSINPRYDPLILPTWLDHLKQLEVLDMGDQSVKFPNVTLKMDRLRYFCADSFDGPMRIDKWRNIKTLKYIMQKDWMRCSSRLITGSCGVRELGIRLDLENGFDELSKVTASLEKMENLVTLHLLWNGNFPIGTTIFIPNLTNLTKLKLGGDMTKCLDATAYPPNLTQLKLRNTCLLPEEDPMPELGKLPKLLYLMLSRNAFIGERMRVLHDGFPCLKTLSLQGMDDLRTIDIEQGGMPQLKQLRFCDCPALNTNNLPLHIVSVVGVNQVESKLTQSLYNISKKKMYKFANT